MRDLVIIGGGPAGMAAALAAREAGVEDILILERDKALGGILQQCVHNGFGLHTFGEELTGPEYAWKYIDKVHENKIEYKTETMVLSISPERVITATNAEEGIFTVEARAIILAMGCRERPRGALAVPGTRPAGIFSAGTAQKLMNCMGYSVGREAVILGSGDIGLIMARRMTLEGAKVKAVCELMPYSGGLARNIQQCLHDFDIPLKLSHTVTEIHGKERLCGVTVAKVDENRKPIPGTEEYIACDTLLLSVGLIPENELSFGAGIRMDPITGGPQVTASRETSAEGIFACGNVLHVHDLVDFVSGEAETAGKSAAAYIAGKKVTNADITLRTDGKIRYTVPQKITEKAETTVYFRVANVYRNAVVTVEKDGEILYQKKRPKMAPGEMEKLILSADLLPEKGELCFGLEEASE